MSDPADLNDAANHIIAEARAIAERDARAHSLHVAVETSLPGAKAAEIAAAAELYFAFLSGATKH